MGKLIKIDSGLTVKRTSDINEYLKPLSRDILLFTTNIGATYRLKDKMPLFKLNIGDHLSFRLGDSKYVDNLIYILNDKEELVGYVPEADSSIFARLMDAGKMLFAIVKNRNSSTAVPLIEIDIYLRDF